MVMRIQSRFAAGFAGLGAIAAGGCTTAYQVDVRNQTPQPVVVAVFQARGSGQVSAITPARRIGPGDRDALATRAVPQDWVVFVQADTPGNPGYPARLDLVPGLNVVTAIQEGEGQQAALRLRAEPRQ
jgi:hypothetical protein